MGGEVNQQYPQQPQQPGQYPQPQWGQPTQPTWGAPPPQPPKKSSAGKIIGLGCAGILGFAVVAGVIGAVTTSGGSKNSSSGTASSVSPSSTAKAAGGNAKAKTSGSKAADTVVFKVWGTAPAGALGGLDIQYGSDTDTRKGTFKGGKFEATLPLNKDAMYYQLNAQLQGSGDINCSVTVGGHTKTGHASGGFNICMAQLSSGLFGDWS